MSIVSAIQKHFQQRRSITIPVPMAITCKTFDKFSRTGIIHGHIFNPFSNYYKFKVHWNGDVAILDGPYRPKTMPLSTTITLERGIGNTYTTLALTMQMSKRASLAYLLVFAFLSLVYLGLIIFSLSQHRTLVSLTQIAFMLSVHWILVYVITWVNIAYSSNLIVKNLPLNFSMVSGD